MDRPQGIAVTGFATLLLLLAIPEGQGAPPTGSAEEMAHAASGFLEVLTPDQRAAAHFSFQDQERFNWHFIPRERRGLSLGELTDEQRERTSTLLESGLSQEGYLKASTIMELELVLRELGGNPDVRDPDLYYVSIFGEPGGSAPWGWRFEGHHLSLNFTVVDGAPVAWAPAFFGANPAQVREGSREGLRPLAAEEDLARSLVRSLSPEQQDVAVVDTETPRDIITGNALQVDPLSPAGISVAELSSQQVDQLVLLLDEYLSRMADDLARERRERIQASGLSEVGFVWAGSLQPGEPHYYRIQGPTFLVEYDNTQNEANHIHSVWRDFDGDFGRDLLREHYEEAPHPH